MSTPHTDNERSRTIMEDETEHTPGPSTPWTCSPRKDGKASVWGSDGDRVAVVEENLAYEETAMDRARLICAAANGADSFCAVTELVEALEAMLDLYGPYADMLIHRKGNRPVSEDKRVVYRAREALAKVRPETQDSLREGSCDG